MEQKDVEKKNPTVVGSVKVWNVIKKEEKKKADKK